MVAAAATVPVRLPFGEGAVALNRRVAGRVGRYPNPDEPDRTGTDRHGPDTPVAGRAGQLAPIVTALGGCPLRIGSAQAKIQPEHGNPRRVVFRVERYLALAVGTSGTRGRRTHRLPP